MSNERALQMIADGVSILMSAAMKDIDLAEELNLREVVEDVISETDFDDQIESKVRDEIESELDHRNWDEDRRFQNSVIDAIHDNKELKDLIAKVDAIQEKLDRVADAVAPFFKLADAIKSIFA